MKASRIAIAALLHVAIASPAAAIPISDATPLSDDDAKAIAQLEQIFFDSIEDHGLSVTSRDFAANGGADLPDEFVAETEKVDTMCGKIVSAQWTKISNKGNYFAQRHITATFENCVLFFVTDYIKLKDGWTMHYFNFNSDPRQLGPAL